MTRKGPFDLMVKLTAGVFVIAAAAVVGCGGESIDVDCSQFQGRYFELASGRSWTYRVTDQNGTRVKSQSVGALEDVGGEKAGTMAFRLTTTKAGGMVISWQQDLGDKIVRHREQDMAGTTMTDEYYVPSRLRLDETPAHIVDAAMWNEAYREIVYDVTAVPPTRTETMKAEAWTVDEVDQPIRVPAGDYCALRVIRSTTVNGVPSSTKTYWFTRGVGKIKESADANTQVEELVSFTR